MLTRYKLVGLYSTFKKYLCIYLTYPDILYTVKKCFLNPFQHKKHKMNPSTSDWNITKIPPECKVTQNWENVQHAMLEQHLCYCLMNLCIFNRIINIIILIFEHIHSPVCFLTVLPSFLLTENTPPFT